MDEFLPVMYDEWNDHLKKKAEKELNENAFSIPKEIEDLKRMIAEHKLPCYTDDSFLTWFLRGKKHDVQRSFDQLRRYADERHKLMNFYGFMFFKNTRVPIEDGMCGILPKRDAEGRVIMYIRPSQWSPDKCVSDNFLRAIQSLSHFALQFPATQVNGFSVIFDSQLASLNVLKLAIKYIHFIGPTISVFPARFQKIYIVNVNAVFRAIAPLFMAVVPPKLRGRTSFYGEAKIVLPKIFSPSILPEEFGGTMGPLNELYGTWLGEYEAYLPKLQATNKYYKRENTINFPETEEMWEESATPQYFS